MSAVLDKLAMSPPARGREEILGRLFELFRETGYAGASMSDIARVTGLKAPSLYHHFPGGKAEMAEAVADSAADALGATVLAALDAPGERSERIGAMLDAVRELYENGRRPCVSASLMLGPTPDAVSRATGRLVRRWIDRLAGALVETGAGPEAARRAATDAIARIQGSLIVARALGDPTSFQEALDAVEPALSGT
ncbi:MAG: TetR/AcrR family transcriptional regulator [Pseudomonadota bacterium]